MEKRRKKTFWTGNIKHFLFQASKEGTGFHRQTKRFNPFLRPLASVDV